MSQSHNDIHRLQSQHGPTTASIRSSVVKWGDAETDQTLHGLSVKE